MGVGVFFVLCSIVGGIVLGEMTLEADLPFLRVRIFDNATLKCCITGGSVNFNWLKQDSFNGKAYLIPATDRLVNSKEKKGKKLCGVLNLIKAQLNDTGLYQCNLTGSEITTHGTYLQVYKPMEKMINLSERTKNTILTVEGVLLLICVLVPSATLLLKSKGITELEMKKAKAEEENIYQGLNLDDCRTTYDQIERSQAQGMYQDVCNAIDEGEDIQLEKP